MKNWLDNMLLKLDKESVIKLYLDECSPEEIQQELNMSLPWIKQVIEEYKEEQDSKGYEAYERSLEDLSCEAQ